MTSFNTSQRGLLAELLKFNEKSHPWLYKNLYLSSFACQRDEPSGKELIVPCPLTGGYKADCVWLAPLWHWLFHQNHPQLICGGDDRGNRCHYAHCYDDKEVTGESYESATAALLLAAYAAGIPEIVEIFNA